MLELPAFVSILSLAVFAASSTLAQTTSASYLTGTLGNTQVEGNGTGPNEDGKWIIEDEGIRAYFVPYGASITNLFVNDSSGIERDVVLGYDNATFYGENNTWPKFGGVPGRYANRIMNSTFNVNGYTYDTIPNEKNLNVTIDGGPWGWEHRNWTVVAHTTKSITFSLHDHDGAQGFPGEVMAYVTYTVTPSTWNIRMAAISLTKVTPIMLTSNVHWNLDGFQNPDTSTILNHTLLLPYSGTRLDISPLKLPTGTLLPNALYSINDFWSHPSGKPLGRNLTSRHMPDNCGQNCTGYDNAFLVNRGAAGPYSWLERGPVAVLRSAWSGVRMELWSDQEAVQVYTCNGMDGTLPLKRTQGLQSGRKRVVERWGCVALGVEDWIGAVNQPEWQRGPRQLFGPADAPYVAQAQYRFLVEASSVPHCTETRTGTASRTTTRVSTARRTTTTMDIVETATKVAS